MSVEKNFNVSNSTKIAWIFKSLKDDRQLVSIDFRESERSLISCIIDVDREKGDLAIDGSTNSNCNDLALSGEPFALNASLNGVDVTAEGLRVKSVLQDSDGPIYIVPLPKEIRYVQRRELYRARVTGLVRVPVDVATVSADGAEPSFEHSEVKLSNLSAEGCRLEIPGTQKTFASEVGDRLVLKIHIPDCGEPLQVSAAICHNRHLTRSRLWYVGCQFISLDLESQNAVNKFVSDLQLLERRKEKMFADE